mgnify:FL=1
MTVLTVQDLLGSRAAELKLTLVAGAEYCHRPIREPAVNRPGLALTGFYRYFANRRVQICGLAEMTYLKTLPPEERADRWARLFAANIPCLILARNLRATPDLLEAARRHRTPVLRTGLHTSRLAQIAARIIEDLTAPSARVQGTTVDMQGIGIMIEGPPGIGKSEIALGLLHKGCSLVADDVTELRRLSSGLIASSAEVTRYHMEIRGIGIIHVPSLLGVASVRREKRLDMVVRLEPADPSTATVERAGLEPEMVDLLGVPVPRVVIPVAPGRDITHIIEVAALNLRLRQLGHDAAKELDQQVIESLLRETGRVND